jgi:hypothetical protein
MHILAKLQLHTHLAMLVLSLQPGAIAGEPCRGTKLGWDRVFCRLGINISRAPRGFGMCHGGFLNHLLFC